jgi:hypothetical protein
LPPPSPGGLGQSSGRSSAFSPEKSLFPRDFLSAAGSGREDFAAEAGFASNLEYFTQSQRLALFQGTGEFIRNANMLQEPAGDEKVRKPVLSKQAVPLPSSGMWIITHNVKYSICKMNG